VRAWFLFLQKKSHGEQIFFPMGNDEHRRLLPNCFNGIHIIDGPEYRYFLGIIDFLTLWTFKQRINQTMKLIKTRCGDQSTVPPSAYADRLVNFITEHTL
jgi:phosphatidylinositol-4-phosphate 5-kinase-like protein 1